MAAEVKVKAEAIQRSVAGTDTRVAGVVRVTISEPMGAYFVQQLPALRERHPELVVDVLADLRMYDLMRGEADIAVRVNSAPDDLIGTQGIPDRSPAARFLREIAPDAKFVMRCNGYLQIFNATLGGFGIGPLPCFLGDSESYLVRVFPQAFPTGRLRLLVRPDLAKLPRVRATLDFLTEILIRDEALFDGTSVQP